MGTTRNILNISGVIVGTLTLPVETTEEQWAQALAPYQQAIVVVYQDVTARQIRQALVRSGKSLDTIKTALESMPEPIRTLALIEWDHSNMFVRSNPLVAQVALALDWTPEQLDQLWTFAQSL